MIETFENKPLELRNLPQFEKVDLIHISNKYVKVIHINMIFTYFILICLSIAYYFLSSFNPEIEFKPIFPVLILSLFLVIHVYNFFYNKTKKYCFRAHDVIYKRGLISEITTIVPFNKMQHIALNQGWISRMNQLATLQFFTAGGSSIDLSIPGLPVEEAMRYQSFVLNFISQNVEKSEEPIKEMNENTISNINESEL